MQLFPQGFLTELYCLRALPPCFAQELGGDRHLSEAEAGELLLVDDADPDRPCFVGACSGRPCTLACLVREEGQTVLPEVFRLAQEKGEDAPRLAGELISLSGMLHDHREHRMIEIAAGDGRPDFRPVCAA